MGSKYKGLKITSGRRKLHYAWAPLFVAVWVLLYYLVTLVFHTLPNALTIVGVDNANKFIAERAQNDLRELTFFGPRVVGSPANEQVAVKFLIEKVEEIRKHSSKDYTIETDVQIASGSYVLQRVVNNYHTIQNFIVKLTPKASNSNCSLLINSHFDTVPGSSGAGDDGMMVVVMLEVLRVLSKSADPPKHSIIFLFNGAEENPLQGSHAFITQHKWAPNVKAFINLDSAGNGGREVLFQSGPNHPWLMRYYRDYAVHPYASTTAEELFQNKFIPSDTDFRIFRDYGHIPGLDFAHSYNDYVYHTKYDRFGIIPPGTYQNTGDNILAMAKALANAPELENTSMHAEGHTVFFDFLNLFLVFYPEHIGLIMNISISVVALILISVSLWWMSDNSGVTVAGVLGRFALTFILQLVSVAVAAGLAITLAFISDVANLSLSWFSQPWIIFGLYFCPFFFGLGIVPAVYLHVTRENSLLLNHRVQLFLHSQCMLLIIILSLLTAFNIRSAFILMISVLFYAVSLGINLITTMHNKQLLWIIPHLASHILPFVFFSYQSYSFFTSLIPMAGRSGAEKNPELLICGASVFYGLLLGGFLIPLFSIFRKSALIVSGFFIITLIFICIMLSPIGFPYTAETAPQRYQVLHTKRVFHDGDQSIRATDSGYFIFSLDRNTPWTIRDHVSNTSSLRNVNEFCEEAFYCGVPVYNYRHAKHPNDIYWIPAGDPNLIRTPKLRLLSREARKENIIRFTFELSGPDHMSILVSPVKDVKLVKWSFAEIPFDKWEPPYYSYYSYGLDPSPFEFFLDLKTPSHWNQPFFDIAVTGHLTHHNIHQTTEFKEFLKGFPKWSYVTAWMSSYESWRL